MKKIATRIMYLMIGSSTFQCPTNSVPAAGQTPGRSSNDILGRFNVGMNTIMIPDASATRNNVIAFVNADKSGVSVHANFIDNNRNLKYDNSDPLLSAFISNGETNVMMQENGKDYIVSIYDTDPQDPEIRIGRDGTSYPNAGEAVSAGIALFKNTLK